jgi:hypothetical protein
MAIVIVIAAWALGSFLLALLLGRVFRLSARRGRLEERLISSAETAISRRIASWSEHSNRT